MKDVLYVMTTQMYCIYK